MTDKPSFLDRIRTTPLVFDGAMGTMIYHSGVFLNVCYDELCLTRPELIAGIHREYVEAGADVIETNTFGANRMKLGPYGLGDQVERINRAGVRLAREVAGDDAYVAGSAGPCLPPEMPIEPGLIPQITEAFAEQFAAMAAEGADLVALETFDKIAELQVAAAAARRQIGRAHV